MFTHIRPLQEKDMPALIEQAREDNHEVIFPTFHVERSGQTLGYIGIVPSVILWMDTRYAKARDSVAVANFFENHLVASGAGPVLVPVPKHSPFHPHMGRAGYVRIGNADCFIKNLKG